MAYTNIDKPSDYFDTLLSTGDGGSHTFTGLDFQPDWVWSKRRQTHVHQLYDSVRGAGSGKAIQSDSNAAEGGDGGTYGYLSSFTSDGFASTVGSSNNNYFNADGATYVFWNWRAGTSVSGNTSGSGTAKAYTGSVNTDAGFSIIRHLGNDTAGHTIPHHLGAVPKMIIGHGISGDDATSWTVYHHSLGNTHTISLNETGAAVDASVWNDTTPTSSVISLGSSGNVNDNDDAFILYSFAEKKGYSKFGSYTGNGDDDGLFVYTGFKPAFVMIKMTSEAQNWGIYDNKRLGYNEVKNVLFPNLSNAENANLAPIDLLSNGFKMRKDAGGSDQNNKGGGTYIYMAFAEQPFTTSTGVPATAK
jgi:hypothetical protein